MGADMIVAAAVLPKRTAPDWTSARGYIAALRATRLRDRMGEEQVAELTDVCDVIPYISAQTMAELRSELRSALREFETAVDGSDRELTWLTLRNGDVVYLTGGMSWGDAPTELYEAMEKLVWTGVLEAAGFEP